MCPNPGSYAPGLDMKPTTCVRALIRNPTCTPLLTARCSHRLSHAGQGATCLVQQPKEGTEQQSEN